MVNEDIRSWLTDEERQESYEKGLAEGREEGREEGIAIGETKKNKANAERMLALGASADFVRQVTGLSEEEVKSLMN